MDIKGANEAIKMLNDFSDAIQRAKHLDGHIIMSDSQRIASTKEEINERGSLKDRLAQTDEEAETIARVEDIRDGRPSSEPVDLTTEQQEAVDDAIVERLVDDFIKNTIFRE